MTRKRLREDLLSQGIKKQQEMVGKEKRQHTTAGISCRPKYGGNVSKPKILWLSLMSWQKHTTTTLTSRSDFPLDNLDLIQDFLLHQLSHLNAR